MSPDAWSARLGVVAARPVAELLECPKETGSLLSVSTQSLGFNTGEVVFRQGMPCRGLYLIVSGHFLRHAERLDARVLLGPARVGEFVELGAALGSGSHTYTLTAQEAGSVLLFPFDSLQNAFRHHPPLRMHLLEELAREVSRAYTLCSMTRIVRTRRSAAAEDT